MPLNMVWGLLYWDGSRLQVGTYTKERGLRSSTDASINLSNVIFAKMGSVVGFTHTGTSDSWGSNDVKFNPTTYATSSFATWTNILSWSDYAGTKAYTDGYISSSAYHNATNVKAGYGDICKLAGYTATQANNGSIDNGEWRLPTDYENQLFMGDPSLSNFSGGIIKFKTDHSLPALGWRYQDGGEQSNWGTGGIYWSSAAKATAAGYALTFTTLINASIDHNPENGFSTRCVYDPK